jgi:hypothetical protein
MLSQRLLAPASCISSGTGGSTLLRLLLDMNCSGRRCQNCNLISICLLKLSFSFRCLSLLLCSLLMDIRSPIDPNSLSQTLSPLKIRLSFVYRLSLLIDILPITEELSGVCFDGLCYLFVPF